MLSMTEYMKICRTLLHRHIRTCMCGALCDLLAPPPPLLVQALSICDGALPDT